jgi:hypothetical protein
MATPTLLRHRKHCSNGPCEHARLALDSTVRILHIPQQYEACCACVLRLMWCAQERPTCALYMQRCWLILFEGQPVVAMSEHTLVSKRAAEDQTNRYCYAVYMWDAKTL